MKYVLSFLLILLIFSCRKESNDWDIYKIYGGNHKCNGWRGDICGSKLEEWWKFEEDCYYTVPNSDSLDWNKLTGLGDLDNQKNSIRVGWRCINNTFQVCAYVHNKVRYQVTDDMILKTVKANQPFRVRIVYNNNSAEIQVDNKIFKVEDISRPNVIFKQYPWFGGQETAPHDMTLYTRQNQPL